MAVTTFISGIRLRRARPSEVRAQGRCAATALFKQLCNKHELRNVNLNQSHDEHFVMIHWVPDTAHWVLKSRKYHASAISRVGLRLKLEVTEPTSEFSSTCLQRSQFHRDPACRKTFIPSLLLLPQRRQVFSLRGPQQKSSKSRRRGNF